MRYFIFFILLNSLLYSKNIIKPYKLEKTWINKMSEQEFLKRYKIFEKSWKDKLTADEEKLVEGFSEAHSNYWDPLGGGCSWYCGGSVDKISASSTLESSGKISYDPKNLHDFNIKTAWVENKIDYGIGEYIEYVFSNENPRINEIIILNGYAKSDKSFTENSRVKSLELFVNDEYLLTLELKDNRLLQKFKLPVLGRYNDKKGKWILKLVVKEIYEGSKYKDTAISEIYFDGLDVH